MVYKKMHRLVRETSAKREKRGATFEMARCGAFEQANRARRVRERDGHFSRFVFVYGDVGVHRLVHRGVSIVVVIAVM